jgi:N-methylhydantoinase A
MYLGIDVGGTFTDLVLMDEGGNISTAKAPTTPGELEKGVFDAVAVAAKAQGLGPEELLSRVTAFGHGTTQATNALIERTGATTGLITTRGFGDTLALQRLMGFTAGIPVEHLGRYSRRRYPDPIVPRRLVREVRERVDQAGRVLVPLGEDSVRSAIRELIDAGVETFAVALLWSFRNPVHEERVGVIIRGMAPDAFISLSCQVSPIIGESSARPRPCSTPIWRRKSPIIWTGSKACCATAASAESSMCSIRPAGSSPRARRRASRSSWSRAARPAA